MAGASLNTDFKPSFFSASALSEMTGPVLDIDLLSVSRDASSYSFLRDAAVLFAAFLPNNPANIPPLRSSGASFVLAEALSAGTAAAFDIFLLFFSSGSLPSGS